MFRRRHAYNSHVSVLVLPVGLSVVTDDPVGVGSGGALCVRRSDLSVKRIVKTLEETLSQVHVSDGIDGLCENHTSGKLAVAVAPVVLNTLDMPLVHKDNDLLCLALIDLLEKILIALVNENLLQSGEEDGRALNIPVDEVLIEALLGKCLGV